MASWSAMDALLDARAAWERVQMQTFLDFDALEEGDRGGASASPSSSTPLTRLPDAMTTAAPAPRPPRAIDGEQASGSSYSNTTALGGASPAETRATEGR